MRTFPVRGGRLASALVVAALTLPFGTACDAQPPTAQGSTAHTSAASASAAPPSHSSSPTPSPRPSATPGMRMLQQGYRGAHTFTDPHHPSQANQGVTVKPMSYVPVICRVSAPEILTANPDGFWYRLGGPWHGRYYAVANTFWNGDVPGHKPYMHDTDYSVPEC